MLNGEGQNYGLLIGSTASDFADSGTPFDRMAFQSKGAYCVPVCTQQSGEVCLPDIAADNRKGRRLVHNKFLLCPILCCALNGCAAQPTQARFHKKRSATYGADRKKQIGFLLL